MNSPSILFVCTANQCRSPMAEFLFRSQLSQVRPEDWKDWRIESAGTWTEDGRPAADLAVLVMARRNLDLTQHRSRIVTAEMVESFDLILVMEPGHKEAMQIEFPKAAGRIFLLSEMQGKQITVKDPSGDIDTYETAAEAIQTMLSKGMPRILSLIDARHTA